MNKQYFKVKLAKFHVLNMIWPILLIIVTLHYGSADEKYCTKGKCPDSMTCCEVPQGAGCCPYRNGVCCDDEIHCCPQGYSCDSGGRRCTKSSGTEIHTVMASEINGGNVTTVRCPDGRICPDVSTCCLIHVGVYGCCPYYNAVCCSDLVHCCPQYTQCYLGYCHSTDDLEENKISEDTPQISLNEHLCSESNSTCPADHTCCPMQNGSSACCPLKSAVCCSGIDMCCPNGYQCDISNAKCVKEE